MQARGQTIFHATIAIILTCPSMAQQNPGLSTKPSGRSIDDTTPPAEQPVDLTRPTMQQTLPSSSLPGEELYLEAAVRGEAWAQTKLGKIYLQEHSDAEHRRKGIAWLERAAAQRDPEAVYLLSKPTTADTSEQLSSFAALQRLNEAAELGNAEAQYDLAALMASTSSTSASSGQALDLAKKAAAQGHAAAQYAAGVSLLRRASGQQDISEGLDLLEKAAAQNHREARMVLAGIVTRGEFGLAKNQRRAEALLKPRAEQGDPQFQFGLATLYLYGDQMVSRKEDGVEWLRRSAGAGFEESKELLLQLEGEQATRRE